MIALTYFKSEAESENVDVQFTIECDYTLKGDKWQEIQADIENKSIGVFCAALTDLEPGNKFLIRVLSVNEYKSSLPSQELAINIPTGIPDPPTIDAIGSETVTTVRVSWKGLPIPKDGNPKSVPQNPKDNDNEYSLNYRLGTMQA